jgi:hypothetical protein
VGRIVDFLLGPKVDREAAPENEQVDRAALAQVDGLLEYVVPEWAFENLGVGMPGSTVGYGNARLAERVWVANRCQQMVAQQIASMPLEFHGNGGEPMWVSNPDPELFPNGIGDAVHAVVENMYGWGYALLYITDFYADGFARNWTVLDSALCEPRFENGRRVYPITGGDGSLDAARVIQIDRNPGTRAHGTSALRAYGQLAFGLLAASEHSLSVNQGGIPFAYLKSQRPINAEQAAAIQAQWMMRTANRGGAPPVLPPEIDAEALSINPVDLALLDTQEYNSRAIATAYGVPSVLLNMALQGGLTYQNPAALGEMWWRFELRNVATKLANALSARCLPRASFVNVRAEDTFASLTPQSTQDDEQAAVDQQQPNAAAQASPSQQAPAPARLTAI